MKKEFLKAWSDNLISDLKRLEEYKAILKAIERESKKEKGLRKN